MADTSTHSWKLLYEAGRQALQARKLQEAEQSFSAALQLAEDFAAGDPRLAATLNALARIYSLQRRYLAAAALLNRLLEVTERTLGPAHVQVAGVLTNLAEMYTHLGAAREELELRERVLGIRADDPNADAGSLQRLRERVDELRTALAAQEPPAVDDDDYDSLPTVRTAEYSAPIATVDERAPAPVQAAAVVEAPARPPVVAAERDAAYRMSPATASLTIAPWPGPAATGNTPTDVRPIVQEDASHQRATASAPAAPVVITAPSLEPIAPSEHSVFAGIADHGFTDMGRDELRMPFAQRLRGRSSLYSIAAGVVLVAGVLAARDYIRDSDDGRVSAGSVSLANVPAAAVVPAALTAPVVDEAPTVEELVAERREARRREAEPDAAVRPLITERAPRVPSAAELERALRGIDGAVKVVDQRTRAATDSVTAIRVQIPAFKKSRMADP
jgi:hypothetical protein